LRKGRRAKKSERMDAGEEGKPLKGKISKGERD
jgi:hypothetical protein